ncbi:RluA family pseudouridine synthase [Flammeovirga aprica]|uniref:RluA family pseudouridine synthase n=1 Tax=Flammeovirga aprica JL-4 TaxID=694437 RepID=A0A7X9NZP2_9BACT|nr:RluA family pseudouridine synthase [Flammeovirga aprica]NME66891.1 RluA family pseudouridine synthase [Flammeovirga aprica JL-4]
MEKTILEKIQIPDNLDQKERFFDFILRNSQYVTSRNGLKKALKAQRVICEGQILKGAEWIVPGQEIVIYTEEAKVPKIFELKLDVIFEDEDLAVVYKPSGIPVSGNQFKTIENALLSNISQSNLTDTMPWPKPCHRLDAPTSGLLLIAKTRLARVKLGQQFEDKTIKKKYHAVAMGSFKEKEGDIKHDLEGKPCHSSYKVVKEIPSLRSEALTLVELEPHTGRTHQLRKHLAMIGHPIVGDKEYGEDGNTLKGKGLFLSSTAISFVHPRTEERNEFSVAYPSKFETLLERETKMWEKYKGKK